MTKNTPDVSIKVALDTKQFSEQMKEMDDAFKKTTERYSGSQNTQNLVRQAGGSIQGSGAGKGVSSSGLGKVLGFLLPGVYMEKSQKK